MDLMNSSDDCRYEFGPFVLDPREQKLTRDGIPVSLPPKDFDILVALVRRAGSLVEKEVLVKEVWPDDRFVEEANVSRRVYAVRRALGDEENVGSYIETVPKRGYRFVFPVRQLPAQVSVVVLEKLKQTRIVAREQITVHDTDPPEIVRAPQRQIGSDLQRRRIDVRSVIFAAIGVGLLTVAIILLVRHYRAPTPLTERDVILLADFENRTGDPVFDGTLKQGLAVQLEQSPFLSVFSDDRVRETLRYMGRSPDDRITREVAREVCERQGLKAMLLGTIVNLGSRYVVSIEAVEPRSGQVLARQQQEANGKEEVLRALGSAASGLREKLGESLQSIQKYDAPIEQATTSSLDGFKAYTAGEELRRRGKYQESLPMFEHAVEIDPNFALAHSKLATTYSTLRQPGRAADSATRAFELRQRVTELERLYITSVYYSDVTGELAPQIEALELLTQIYPRHFQAWNNLALIQIGLCQYEKALANAREAFRLNPASAAARSNVGTALLALNRFDEAEAFLRQAVADKVDSTGAHLKLLQIAYIKGNREAMKEQLDWATQNTNDHAELAWQADVADFEGRRQASRELRERRFGIFRNSVTAEFGAEGQVSQVARDAIVGFCDHVRQRVDVALSAARNKNTLPLSALSLALCGDGEGANSLAKELKEMYPKRTEILDVTVPEIEAAAHMSGPGLSEATQVIKNVIPYELSHGYWPAYVRGLVQLRAHDAAGAQNAFQNILDHAGVNPLSMFRPLSYLGLARAYALSGDTVRSRKAYDDFFTLWKDADADIPILQQAKQEYERLH
jgi:eukaryotic-like serine/threonine-protein kinase